MQEPDVKVGLLLYNGNQPVPVKVIAKDDKTITFDANHEMAGKELILRLNWWMFWTDETGSYL